MSQNYSIRPAADKDLDKHLLQIAADNPDVARRFRDAAMHTMERLAENPHLGGRLPSAKPEFAGVRIWQIKGFPNHLVFYRPASSGIEVLRIMHAAQDWHGMVGW